LAQPAAVLQPEEPDAAAVRLPVQDAAGAAQAVRAAAEEPQLEVAARAAAAVRPREEPDAGAVLPREVRDVAVEALDVRQVAPGAEVVLLSAAALWVFPQVLPLAPLPAERFAHAMKRWRMASP
jgi:hypothetical protein